MFQPSCHWYRHPRADWNLIEILGFNTGTTTRPSVWLVENEEFRTWDKSSGTSGRDPVAQAGAELNSPKAAVRLFCSPDSLPSYFPDVFRLYPTLPQCLASFPDLLICSLGCCGKDPGMNLLGLDPKLSSNFLLDLERAPSFQPLGIEQPGFLIQFQTQTLLLRARHLLQNPR